MLHALPASRILYSIHELSIHPVHMDWVYILYTANMHAPDGQWNVYRGDGRGGGGAQLKD